ncbi:MAG: YSIRK-type signal peptide-containing protein [Lactobacillus sp.]|jgi:hypothetical protein|nr:YSIRK-type signal peptide-containing protein [Lactobacillus sp.]
MKKSDLNKNPDLLRHYSLRKLSVGVASVVLGTTAVLGAAQTVKADTTNGQSPAEATQTASSTPDSASDGNQGNGNDFNSANAYAAYVLPKGQSESSYVNSFAAQLNQQQTTANQSQIQTQAPSANNANTQAATASSNNVTTAPYAMSVAEANAANNSVNTNSSSTSEQQNSGQAVSSSDYTVTSHKVYKIQGSGEQDRSYVDAHIDLSFTNNQNIKAGDYIDVHLGVQMDDGTEENYSSGLAGASDLTIGGVKIGSIVPENTSTSGYYRIIFNENFSKLVNPTISLDLKWFNQYGNDPIQMVLHTNNKSVTTYTPTNDLKIGDQSFDSGLKDLPVEYLTGNETQKAQPNVVLKSVLLPVHVWVKGQGETDQKLETIARYFLADNMSHDFTISLAAFQNGSLTTNWYSDETVANEIKQALQNYNSYTTTKAHAIDNSDVGTFTQVQNLPAAPEVTVTSDTPTTSTHDSNYAIKKYHIVIGGTDDLKFGQNGYIDLADITSNDGVDVSPSNSSYEADEASRKANKQTYSKSVSADPIVKEWVTNSVYAGPDLNNKALQNTLFSNPAFWTMVHNNTDDTNYQLGGTLEVGPGNFGGSVAQRDTLPTQSGDNTSDVKGEIMATIKYIDDDTGKTLKEDSAHGLIGETIKFPDYDNKLQAYEAQGYEVDKKKTTYTTGATYQADFAKNKFEVHLTKKDTTPTEDTYSKDLIFKDLNNHEVAHVSGAFTGKLTNGAATIPAADIKCQN